MINESFLNAIKGEKRQNLGKRFKRWIVAQNGFVPGSTLSQPMWKVSELRAIAEITEAIIENPNNEYFVYSNDKLICKEEDIPFISMLHIMNSLFIFTQYKK